MSAIATERRSVIVNQLLATPVASRLGIRLGSDEADAIRLQLPFDPANVTQGDVVHGGVIATLADIAAVAGAVAGAGTTASRAATANLAITYLEPADGSSLVARASVLRSGRRQHVVRVEIATFEGVPVAEALATVMLS